ncbi:hypothetical protein BDK51DRAFT_44402 [Blyttiomyces helicus]|uniref:Uncharacterized protein n=1 Tax=Blyttiomyces helicus TaxID=388810 RepID=A0A4V1IPM8_9FUNG|nr:hypothetical protein BDK51DRAFT_44402 [Blyttiomyces helicus]|eukprot:RKO83607.1 hypothetical protein BDK51DRAFT_44402 [Blyttiomyces helicus]
MACTGLTGGETDSMVDRIHSVVDRSDPSGHIGHLTPEPPSSIHVGSLARSRAMYTPSTSSLPRSASSAPSAPLSAPQIPPLHHLLASRWAAVQPVLRSAVVYADEPFLSCLKWSVPGGIASLFERGAWAVRRFPPVRKVAEDGKEVRIECWLPGTAALTAGDKRAETLDSLSARPIRATLMRAVRTSCYIVLALSEDAHLLELESDPHNLQGVWGSRSTLGGSVPPSGLALGVDDGYFETVRARVGEWMIEGYSR